MRNALSKRRHVPLKPPICKSPPLPEPPSEPIEPQTNTQQHPPQNDKTSLTNNTQTLTLQQQPPFQQKEN